MKTIHFTVFGTKTQPGDHGHPKYGHPPLCMVRVPVVHGSVILEKDSVGIEVVYSYLASGHLLPRMVEEVFRTAKEIGDTDAAKWVEDIGCEIVFHPVPSLIPDSDTPYLTRTESNRIADIIRNSPSSADRSILWAVRHHLPMYYNRLVSAEDVCDALLRAANGHQDENLVSVLGLERCLQFSGCPMIPEPPVP